MLQLENAENRRACALIAALEDEQITTCEFADAIGRLTPEALQLTATVLSIQMNTIEFRPKLALARRMCSTLAAAGRVLC